MGRPRAARSLLCGVRAEHARPGNPGLFAALFFRGADRVPRCGARVPGRSRREDGRRRDYPARSGCARGAVGVVAARLPQHVSEQPDVLARHRARDREPAGDSRLRTIDAQRRHLSFQTAVGRRAETAALGICLERRGHVAGRQPGQPALSRGDRRLDAAAADSHQLDRSAHRPIDSMTGGRVRASSASAPAGGRAVRRLYALTAAGFVLFAIWGSVFPFNFEPASVDAVAARFSSEWMADWSLTDLLSNVLLFVPIGLFLTATVADGRPQRIAVAAAAAFAGSVALSAAIEVVQGFLPSRTPSISPIAAEVCTAGAGAALWWWLGTEIDALSTAAIATVRRSTRTERLLLLYCLVFAVAWLVPADFTLRPAEIGDKYLHKRLLLPFTPSPDAATRTALGLTVAAAVPLGVAAMLCGCAKGVRRTVASGTAIAAGSLVVFEVAQIAVFSRTTDGASLLASVAGALAGTVAVSRRSTRIGVPPRRSIGELAIPIVAWLGLAAF